MRPLMTTWVFIAFTLLGVATAKATEAASLTASAATYSSTSSGQRGENGGLAIEIETVRDPAKLKQLFGSSDLGEGNDQVVVVHVQAANVSLTNNFILQPVQFKLATGEVSNPQANSQVAKDLKTASVILLSPALGFASAFATKHSSAVQRLLMQRELKSATLQTKDTIEGFLFYRVPKELKLTNIILLARATETSSETSVEFQFNLNP